MKVVKAIIALLAVLIIISGVDCFWQEDESPPESAKNNVEENANKKPGLEPVFAIVGSLAVTWLVLRGKE